MRGQPLTLYEREKIEFYFLGKVPIREMAGYLHRHHSVIVRELKRNKDKDGKYRSSTANERAIKRRNKPHRRKLDKDDVLRNWMIQMMRDKSWSPAMIAGKLKNRPDQAWMKGKGVSHETIYQYIYEGEGRFMGLYQYLVRKHKRRQYKHARKSRKNKGILYMTPIHYRTPEINNRTEFGHLESDSVIYRDQKECLSVQYERQTQLLRFHRVPNKSAEATHAALCETIESMPDKIVKSITFDRGTEGAWHWKLRLDYGIDTYHCDGYCSWQKGGVENVNGIIRRYLPIETDLSRYSDGDLMAIQEKINDRPRKSLGWKTPNEAYREILNCAQVVH
jgi:IS30 family transposase